MIFQKCCLSSLASSSGEHFVLSRYRGFSLWPVSGASSPMLAVGSGTGTQQTSWRSAGETSHLMQGRPNPKTTSLPENIRHRTTLVRGVARFFVSVMPWNRFFFLQDASAILCWSNLTIFTTCTVQKYYWIQVPTYFKWKTMLMLQLTDTFWTISCPVDP